MILYDLKCDAGHVFEGWFRNGDTYDQQAAAGDIACAVCGDKKVSKAPMAPRLARSRGEAAAEAKQQAQAMRQLIELRRKVESECDYVGPSFAEEARKIHYGESEKRGIYGEATDEQTKSLADEGIDVARIPWVPRSDA